jgi:hypothetical protein
MEGVGETRVFPASLVPALRVYIRGRLPELAAVLSLA